MGTIYTARQVISLIIIAVIVAGGAGYLMGRSSFRQNQNPAVSSEISALNLGVSPLSSNKILIRDQPVGNEVRVESVMLEKSAWVAIHEDRDGHPGNILGAQLYPAGTTALSTIELLRPTAKGIYYAMLHADDGDRQFDYEKDAPMTGGGSPIMVRFIAGEKSEEL